MAQLSAANKLRNQVLDIDGTVLLCTAGRVDAVLRFQVVPDCLVPFRRDGQKHVFINLDNGPAREAWETARREVFLKARRDRPIPEPIPVAENSNEEWSLSPEDVPLVENLAGELANPKPITEVLAEKRDAVAVAYKCEVCGKEFTSEHALKIHMGRYHKS